MGSGDGGSEGGARGSELQSIDFGRANISMYTVGYGGYNYKNRGHFS
jgi:hypothetical protein